MPTPTMTEDEIIGYLKKTSLPTLLVEGADDASIFRWLETETGIAPGSILPCSGRQTLISIFQKRSTFTHGKLAWLADLDMWRFTQPPPDVSGIIFTTGYSIENDLYAGSQIESLLEPVERVRHEQLINIVCRWFAFEVLEFEAGRPPLVDLHINQLVDYQAMDLSPAYCSQRGYAEPPASKVSDLLKNYKLDIRGKNLLQALVRFLSDSKRNPKYSYSAVTEMCLKLYRNNPHMNRIIEAIKLQIA